MATPIKLTPEQEEAIRASQLATAFKRVFGVDEAHRTSDQILVWNTLRDWCYANRPIFVPDKVGQICPYRAAVTDGRRSVFLDVEKAVNFDPSAGQSQQQQQK